MYLIRRSLAYASYQERRELTAALKTIYRAPTQAAVEAALDAFESSPWGQYPAATRSWRSAREHVTPLVSGSWWRGRDLPAISTACPPALGQSQGPRARGNRSVLPFGGGFRSANSGRPRPSCYNANHLIGPNKSEPSGTNMEFLTPLK